jgi:hypothetical protein
VNQPLWKLPQRVNLEKAGHLWCTITIAAKKPAKYRDMEIRQNAVLNISVDDQHPSRSLDSRMAVVMINHKEMRSRVLRMEKLDSISS